MTLHNRMTAFSFATVVALAALVPSAPANAAEEVGLQEECVPFRAGFGIHQRCTLYVIYDDGTRVASDHYNRDENGMMYDP
ncbi:hypothetical protein EKL94_10720 [Stenotrophomonas maltophilia]|uniref:Transmembrane protein n=2 Tax=Lysobacteraceae TaxID=32033 RepID=A0A431UHI1_STEMA|nr:hypothetical protein EKL94_10720 [Stenotrophomonas maltophilia]